MQAADIILKRARTLKPHPPAEALEFGKTFTDHMLTVDWSRQKGWGRPEIVPFGPITLQPSANCLHYATECFEGMKAHRDARDSARYLLFRPELNMARLQEAAQRLVLPAFDGQELLQCIRALVRLEGHWIPERAGYALYIRPTLLATNAAIGVAPAEEARLLVLASPVGPYFGTGGGAVRLLASDPGRFVRAWPGGTGQYKIGANYGPTVYAQQEAAREGCQQVLWLFGAEEALTEAGTMNCFVLWRRKGDGRVELVTPGLETQLILAGVVRRSVLELARTWGEFVVSERHVRMAELLDAQREGRLLEMFGTGTACVVAPVSAVRYRGRDYAVPLGALAGRLFTQLQQIQTGVQGHADWAVPA